MTSGLRSVVCVVLLAMPGVLPAQTTTAGLSTETQSCLECHEMYTPGIVADWKTSRHAVTTPALGLVRAPLERRISALSVPDNLRGFAVGCYECHALRTDRHGDRFEHFGFTVNVIVSPEDCRTCHPVEAEQYSGSKKAHAHDILVRNPLYTTLMETILRPLSVQKGTLRPGHASMNAKHETCLACHGTTITVAGMLQRESDAGVVELPNLLHWPNQGVGRVNPDGSLGACTACHPRHGFSIEIARKPETCGQCHLEPDVPGYNVYKESKHGNIADARKEKWTWDAVPWTLGRDFSAPTCAACHNALVVNTNNATVAGRTHDFGSRLWVRLFGLIYSHPQPLSGKTYEILNADNLPLPTTFSGAAATRFLIPRDEQGKRREAMAGICRNCHGSDWTAKHFAKLDTTLTESDAMTRAATGLLLEAWRNGFAEKSNPFDEPIEQAWIRQWLFYANSVRSASAMAGPDYAAFKHGWWDLTENLQHLQTMVGGKKGK